ncbi:unnamed protein product [Auanema sp. JU1783]|nr:unnamed protein product [Auanema sp. JU1783]
MDHNTLFNIQSWFRSKREAAQSRKAVLLLMLFNLLNCLAISFDAFEKPSSLFFTLNGLNILSVLLAVYGIYNNKIIFTVPDALIKVCLCSSSLFYTLHLAETRNFTSEYHFAWLVVSYIILMWELQSIIRISFDIIKQSDSKSTKPPPPYHQVISEEQPPSYSDVMEKIEKGGSPISGIHIV